MLNTLIRDFRFSDKRENKVDIVNRNEKKIRFKPQTLRRFKETFVCFALLRRSDTIHGFIGDIRRAM